MDAIRGRSANGVHFPAYASGLGDDEGDVGELVDGLRAGLHRNKKALSGYVRSRDTGGECLPPPRTDGRCPG